MENFLTKNILADFWPIIFMTDHKSKSTGSTEKLDLSLESPPDAGYLSVCYFQMAPSKSGLINKIGYFRPINEVGGGQQRGPGQSPGGGWGQGPPKEKKNRGGWQSHRQTKLPIKTKRTGGWGAEPPRTIET